MGDGLPFHLVRLANRQAHAGELSGRFQAGIRRDQSILDLASLPYELSQTGTPVLRKSCELIMESWGKKDSCLLGKLHIHLHIRILKGRSRRVK